MPFFSKIYGSWSELQRKKHEKILEILKKEKIRVSGRVLDIGSGPFFFEKFLEENGIETRNFVCIDTENQALDMPYRILVLASGDSLPFASGKFSLAFCIDAMHLLESVEDIRNSLKPGGILIASSFFNEQNLGIIEKGMEKKLNGFKVSRKIIMKGDESEIIMLCRKVSSGKR